MFKSKNVKKLEQKLDFINCYLNTCIRSKENELKIYEKDSGKDSFLYKITSDEIFELKFMKNAFENWD